MFVFSSIFEVNTLKIESKLLLKGLESIKLNIFFILQ